MPVNRYKDHCSVSTVQFNRKKAKRFPKEEHMKYNRITAWMTLGLLLLCAHTAEAKWWIFGKSDEAAVTIDYLFINQISMEESETKVLLYKQFLTNGTIDIRGKAHAAKGAIGGVKVSMDDKKTWQDAKLSSDGSFQFNFKPEQGKTYDFYIKVMDTLGKTNNVDESHKQISLSDKNIRSMIENVLNQMVQAYMSEYITGFMTHVSDNFAGDALNLDSAVRRDFTWFDNIQLKTTISNIAAGADGRIYVSISFTRSVVSTKSGQPLRDKGITEFVFIQSGATAKVYSMKQPLIFGLSDAENVATGAVISPQNPNIIVLDGQGNADLLPLEEAINRSSDDPLSGSSIPTPTNLAVDGGSAHHYVDLTFDSTLDFMAAQGVYETVTEESTSPSGPWTEVDKRAYDTFVRLTTDNIAQTAAILYYRVKIERISGGEQSRPSNVVAFDNR